MNEDPGEMSRDTVRAGICQGRHYIPGHLNSGFARALARGWIELDVEVTTTVVSAGFKLAAVAGLVLP